MNRRDTIILSIIVNAGLLVLLFATAVKSDRAPTQVHAETVAKSQKVQKKEEAPVVIAQKEREPLALEDFLQTPPPSKAKESLVDEIVIAKEDLPKAVEIPKPVVKEEAPQNCVMVTVKKGDFLEKIAKAHNTSVAAIMKANKMSATNLKVGQVLQVPINDKNAETGQSSIEADYYVVKDGDNPWLIASKNRIRLDDLLKLNGLDEAKARKLRPGDRLKIR
jgi:peptidoglycan DL-endopeptidase LytF